MAWPTLSSTYNSVWVRMLRIWRCLFFFCSVDKAKNAKTFVIFTSPPLEHWASNYQVFSRMNWLCLRFKTESIEDQLWGLSYPIQITFMKNEEKGKQKCGAVEANFDLLQNTIMVGKGILVEAGRKPSLWSRRLLPILGVINKVGPGGQLLWRFGSRLFY